MIEDQKWELSILANVSGFYQKLLRDYLQGDLPVHPGLEDEAIHNASTNLREILGKMHRWLQLLDMAITPAMVRQALTSDTDPEIAEALLRYYTRKRDFTESDRDKTDLVATFLYRHPRVPGQWERRGYGLDGSLPLSPFEIALIEILADADAPLLPEEHVQLLREFEPLREQVQGFLNFNALIDSGVLSRVRELKQSFGRSFHHPGVLATIAPYNVAFGTRFDELFTVAIGEIKTFAKAVEELGGSILSNVDGVDVTVEHVQALEGSDLLKIDYVAALDKFRRVSKLKKEIDKRPRIRRAVLTNGPVPLRSAGNGAAAAAKPARAAVHPGPVKHVALPVTAQQLSLEEAKLARVAESIRIFVRVADPKFRQVVPMRFFNLNLTAAEVEAYCADYLEEKSVRANVGQAMLRSVAVVGRIQTELEELKRCQPATSLWKLRADALVVLLDVARSAYESGNQVIQEAQEAGEEDAAEAVQASMRKLRERAEFVVKTLAMA
ncbi:MAG TPA: hypothetical protein VK466_16695 [Terriglobales bacterium]|nr:hypothetical protein [Terriglobales bacterium]